MNEICVHWEYELKGDSYGLWWLIVEKRRKERRVGSVLKHDKKMDFLNKLENHLQYLHLEGSKVFQSSLSTQQHVD